MKKLLFALLPLVLASMLNAQMHGNGHINPGELEEIAISGTTIIDETSMNTMYLLDEDGDGNADYNLNFGPYWYSPDSSLAVRPSNGDLITIVGGVHDSYNMIEQTIIVLETNGEFWRDPYFAEWNNMSSHSHQMGDHHGRMMGYGFGWEHDTLVTTEIVGTAVVDTTFYMNHYYLDVNNDSEPDYFLNLGPYWYEPESGAVRPLDGENITILGGLITTSMNLPMVIVYEINGLVWRDFSLIGSHFGGGWFNKNMIGSQQFHSPFDIRDHMTIREGWNNQGGHHGGGMNNYDSLFCQILEIYPENIPYMENMNVMAGYEIQMFKTDGSSGMMNNGMMGGHMQFGSDIAYQMHYTDRQLEYYDADENSIEVKYWDDQSNTWIKANASINTETNSIAFENNIVSNYVILSYDKVTSVDGKNPTLPIEFKLEQNYPNPFNPTTSISYSIPIEGHVTFGIYDLIGSEVAKLEDGFKSAGNYSYSFNAKNLSSGIYFYTIRVGNFTDTKKMLLMK